MAELELRRTAVFGQWLDDLRDDIAVKAIKRRLARIQIGLFGDAKSLGDGLAELRVDHGLGYRVYFTREDRTVVVLLCGGDKGSQPRDIERARKLAAEWRDENGS